MGTYDRIHNNFDNYLNEYIQTNGIQTPLQIKQLAKNFAIQSRNGVYDLTAKKRYCSLFLTYCFQNNIEVPFEGLPEGWGDGIHVCWHDPDSEFTDDIYLQKLITASNKRHNKKIREICEDIRNRRDII